jgi:hypothetical protein
MKRTTLLIVALTSTSLLALEIIWTRLFSAEFFYTYAFLVLSLAIMGLGLGALALRLFPRLNRDGALGTFLSLTGMLALAGPPVVFLLNVDFSILFSNWGTILKLVAMVVLLSATYFCGGLALATLFKRNHSEMPRVYMADLLGAGIGVLAAIIAMNQLGTPAAAVWAAFPVLVAGLIASRRLQRLAPSFLIVAMIILSGSADTVLDSRKEERAPVIYKHWDAMSKIKIYNWQGIYRGLNIDNVANSPVVMFNGDWEAFWADTTEYVRDIDVGYLIDQFESCTFLSLGAGGGSDVFHALDEGATEVHAVEVIPHINKMMVEGDPAGYVTDDSTVVDSTGRLITCDEYSGNIYNDPRVKVVSEDARTYVRRHKNTFDVIFSLSSNTWAALGSGSFALAENYIFTTEAFKDYWEALTDSGFMSMEHQVYMPRLVTEVIDALSDLGVEEPRSHFAVYDLPKLRRNMILISKRPLTDEIRNLAYRELTPERYPDFHLLYPCPDSISDNLINQIVTNGWRAAQDSASVDLSPATDDRPFVAQMGLWRNLKPDKLENVSRYAEFRGFPLTKIMIAVILAVILILIIPLNLLPYFTRGEHLRFGPWLYFFTIGLAFISVEIILIQKYTLFIGASVYSTAAVLLTLLVASGIGSRFARRVGNQTAFWGIVIWLVLDVFVLRHLTNGLSFLGVFPRVLVSAMLIFPVGFFMGMPFPKGALRVRELVDWGFAVNGAASVLGATVIVLIAFTYGFTVALLLAAALYLVANLLLSLKALW